MRTRIVIPGAEHLEYEIRHIVDDGNRLKKLGVDMIWENIGDPIAMGESVAPWIVGKVRELVDNDLSWAYCPSLGVLKTREFLAEAVNARGGATVRPEDILFVNGVADAVDKIYDLVRKDARIIMPTPCYPTHSSNESKRGEYESIFFPLDPRNGWMPDLDELRNKVRYNPQIIGIGLVHPDNPTGLAYPRETLEEIVEIARTHGLFIICDEIYAHITYNGRKTLHLSEVIGDVPALAMRGISKEYPWPGARCGWIEILNRGRDPDFDKYVKAIVDSKMMEVCSTTLPQMSVPLIFGDDRYPEHLRRRAGMYEARSRETYETFRAVDGLIANETSGAFYYTVVFEDGLLRDGMTLPIGDKAVRAAVESMVDGVSPDKRFAYYLMGAEGICVTPLSGFHSNLMGFRFTLLEMDDEKRRDTHRRIAAAVGTYLGS